MDREAYFVRCISALSGIESAPILSDPEPLATFLDDPGCLLLRAFVSSDGTAVLSTSTTHRIEGVFEVRTFEGYHRARRGRLPSPIEACVTSLGFSSAAYDLILRSSLTGCLCQAIAPWLGPRNTDRKRTRVSSWSPWCRIVAP